MALATFAPGGKLKSLNDRCVITIGNHEIIPRILPEITDSKRASYTDTTIIGRSFPIKTYSHSDNRVITMKLHFIVLEFDDIDRNIKDLWALESATYPREGDPYRPPPVCTIECGTDISPLPLCVVLESYNYSKPTNVAWDEDTLLPYYFEVTTTWHVVYSTSGSRSLPNQEQILNYGI